MLAAFALLIFQLLRLGIEGQGPPRASEHNDTKDEPTVTAIPRPDIVDRHGRLIATDIAVPSLFADPALVIDRDEVVEKLVTVLPKLDPAALRKSLGDRRLRFVWVARGLSPEVAQRVHDLGLPGLGFREELKRAYPTGALAGHVIGTVTGDNTGFSGLELHIEKTTNVEGASHTQTKTRSPVRLSIDLGVQQALEVELANGQKRYSAKGAAGIVLDVETGEVLASASVPGVDPAHPAMGPNKEHPDRIAGGRYELGSIFKAFTIAMALDGGHATLDTIIDVRQPIRSGRFTITDLHPKNRPLSVSEIFLASSNVGAGLLARQVGPTVQRAFLERLGLCQPLTTELGITPRPRLPKPWGDAATVTVSYGHGLAVSPLQIANAAAALINGGILRPPTFLYRGDVAMPKGVRVIDVNTSAALRLLMRRNVTEPGGTGQRAEAPGYRVGGKTGTADIPGPEGYSKTDVISSFLAAFPMESPRYIVLVMLFEPKPTAESQGEVTAGLTAAPLAGRVIGRIAPLLGVRPEPDDALADLATECDTRAPEGPASAMCAGRMRRDAATRVLGWSTAWDRFDGVHHAPY